jgi:two-component system KDP operon response regulator KdpE
MGTGALPDIREEVHARGREASVVAEPPPPLAPVVPLVLIVEDEAPMRKVLRILLSSSGLETAMATSGAEAVRRAAVRAPHLVLLDLGLPDEDGIEVVRRLRDWMVAPILVVSARDDEKDKITVLDAGANDYLTKPFSSGELLARIRVWLRQQPPDRAEERAPVLEVGELRLDLRRRLVHVGGREVHLTPIEYKLFELLMRNRGSLLTHRQLLLHAWGPRYANETHYVRVYMTHLRDKLRATAGAPGSIVTEPGVGYRLRSE